MARSRNNRIRLDLIGPEPGLLMGSRRLFARVLSNLLTNALKFTQDGQVTLRVRSTPSEKPDYCRLSVEIEDTGVGIPPDKLERVFDMFETLDTAYNRATEGTGLGLFIAQRAANRMGGAISADSQLGKGSVFCLELTLPIAPPDALPAHPTHAAETPRATPMRILVAEDNAVNRLVLRKMLSHMGHEVEEAQNGALAAEKALSTDFDLVLMDISMPEVDGLEAARRIRDAAGTRAPRIVALTAHALPEDLQHFRDAGLEEVAIKPLSYADLAGLVCKVALEPARTDVTEQLLLNEETLDVLRQTMSPDRFARVVSDFLDEGAAFVAELKSGFSTNTERFLHIIHSFSGACGVFGADQMHRILSACEERIRSDAAANTLDCRAEHIHESWRQTDQAVTDYLQRNRPPVS